MLHTKADILNEAIGTVADRGVPYGGVEQNFGRIALLWDAYLEAKFGPSIVTLAAVDVAAMMGLMKLGRIAGNATHHDSWVDLAGYAACGGELASGIRADINGAAGELVSAPNDNVFGQALGPAPLIPRRDAEEASA